MKKRLTQHDFRISRAAIKRTDDFISKIKAAMIASGIDPEAIKAENKRIATRMGITPLELGMLSVARLKAEITARPDETLQETEARAQEIWKKDKAEHEEQARQLEAAMKSMTEERKKRKEAIS